MTFFFPLAFAERLHLTFWPAFATGLGFVTASVGTICGSRAEGQPGIYPNGRFRIDFCEADGGNHYWTKLHEDSSPDVSERAARAWPR